MTTAPAERKSTNSWWQSPYDRWLVAQDVPVFTGYYVEDLRTIELGWWDLRGCPGAVLNLVGHQGVTEAHVLQIPPGETIPPFRMAAEEIVYVIEGQGIATIWAEGHPQINFEWQKRSLFRIPSNYYYQLSNARGDQPALTLHVSYLPLAMSIQPREEFFFNNGFVDPTELYGSEGNPFSAEAYAVRETVDRGGVKHETHQWHANFFPDLNVWDKLRAYGGRNRRAFGAGITFPNSAIRTGMMVLPPQRYRAAHRHGPGVTIVGVSPGSGFAVMYPEGGEKIVCPWTDASVFVPPNNWFHQHLNPGGTQNRQLRVFPPKALMGYDGGLNKEVPFIEEDPWVREQFEAALAENGLPSLMPPGLFEDPDYVWDDPEMRDKD